MTPIEQAAGKGLSSLFDISTEVTILVLIILAGYMLFKRAIDGCERREERAIEKWSESSKAVTQLVSETNQNLREVAVILGRIEVKSNK